ncbi:peptidase [Thalassotalea euphylliae]|uniref:Peptidase n=1 Tax=Thalassotalea euphylliae TaxID=1655234 RepID=A0A3E0TNL8_9GAMM|nr:prepilin peptidase [Thalassotalea euphylliae]REL25947.1 peptidase [Thalassotalea euphylliae]
MLLTSGLLATGSLAIGFLAIALSVLLVSAGYFDLRYRRIPNGLSLSVLLVSLTKLALVSSFASATITLLLTALLLMIGVAVFALGWLGAGDVKLIVALSLGFSPEQLVDFVVAFNLLGGVLAVSVLVYNGYARRQQLRVINTLPYGVAIASAGLLLMACG